MPERLNPEAFFNSDEFDRLFTTVAGSEMHPRHGHIESPEGERCVWMAADYVDDANSRGVLTGFMAGGESSRRVRYVSFDPDARGDGLPPRIVVMGLSLALPFMHEGPGGGLVQPCRIGEDRTLEWLSRLDNIPLSAVRSTLGLPSKRQNAAFRQIIRDCLAIT